MHTLRVNCVDGITANRERLGAMVGASVGVITALTPFIGYAAAAALAKTALLTGRNVADLVVEAGLMSPRRGRKQLSPARLSGLEAITAAIPIQQAAGGRRRNRGRRCGGARDCPARSRTLRSKHAPMREDHAMTDPQNPDEPAPPPESAPPAYTPQHDRRPRTAAAAATARRTAAACVLPRHRPRRYGARLPRRRSPADDGHRRVHPVVLHRSSSR